MAGRTSAARDASKGIVAGLTLSAAVLIAASTHGVWWKRSLLTAVFTLGALVALMVLRAAWRDRWFWRQTWREYGPHRHGR